MTVKELMDSKTPFCLKLDGYLVSYYTISGTHVYQESDEHGMGILPIINWDTNLDKFDFDYIIEDTIIANNICTCDLFTVLMVSGCRCGGK